jgi:tetratricopeptide (TPR) repeat protein
MRQQAFRLRAGMLAAVLLGLGPLAPESAAWGPRTTTTINGAAAGVLNEAGVVSLSARQRDIVLGAAVGNDELLSIIPTAQGDPIGAISQEMYLLQAVRGQGVDAYFAYRMGVLGKLVASTTAPMATTDRIVREQYFADVDGAIGSSSLQAGRRNMVDPPAYFSRILGEVASREEMLIKDYESGLGFDGVGRAALSQDVGRSAHAVADVWYTIFRGTVALANLPESQLHRYVIDGLRFYIDRDNDAALDAAYDRFMAMTTVDADLRTRIGDMFYEAGARERAVLEYKQVLEEAPARRDVVQRIAEYYVEQGDEALDREQLESAQVAYAEALRFDMLHPSAQEKRLRADRLIRERGERMTADETRVETADALRRQADVRVSEGEYIAAMDHLNEAMSLYQSVSDEFPGPRASANMGINVVTTRMNDLKNQLISNAGALSGSGASVDARMTAEAGQLATNEAALRRLLEQQFDNEIERLRQELGGAIMEQGAP